MNKIIISDIESIGHGNDNLGFVVILHKTGVCFDIQCGGMACDHERPEGFVIVIPWIDDFDDCQYGCMYLDQEPESRKKLANDLEKYFKDSNLDHFIKFDFDRINELKEGYWPILYKLNIDNEKNTIYQYPKGYIEKGFEEKWFPAILYNGN